MKTIVVVQSLSHMTLWDPMKHTRFPCPSPSPRVLLKLMSIESVMPSNNALLYLYPDVQL